jgi:hypothetical protein
MYRALVPRVMTGTSGCHPCGRPLAEGERSWQAAGPEGGRVWLCLACARDFVAGRAGASAERQALRRMRSEPVLAMASPVSAPSAVPAFGSWSDDLSLPSAAPDSAAGGARRWGRLALISLVVVLMSSVLTSFGAAGQALAAVVGFPAAASFWFSVAAMPVAAVRARWTARRRHRYGPEGWPVSTGTPFGARAVRSEPTRTRVTGPEDNWVKGARGEHAVGAALDGTGLAVLHDRRLREGSAANIDHLVVAGDAVYVVDAKNLSGSFSTAGGSLRIDGWNKDSLVQGVRRQAGEVALALRGLGATVPVRPVLCLTGAARPTGVQPLADVLLTTPAVVADVLRGPGPIDDARRTEIADLLAWAFPPAVR